MSGTITKDGVQVELGQRWRNLDKRCDGQIKTVGEIDHLNGKVRWREFPQVKCSIRRMHKHHNGWELVP